MWSQYHSGAARLRNQMKRRVFACAECLCCGAGTAQIAKAIGFHMHMVFAACCATWELRLLAGFLSQWQQATWQSVRWNALERQGEVISDHWVGRGSTIRELREERASSLGLDLDPRGHEHDGCVAVSRASL